MITNKTFDEINIGDTATLERRLTKRDVDLFAVLSGDLNPTHLSEEYAKVLLERQKVSGHSMWAGSLISSLLGNDLPGPGTIYKSQQLDFHNPVELDDELTVTIKVKEKNSQDKTVVLDCLVVNQRSETVVTGLAKVEAPTKKPTGLEMPWADFKERSFGAFDLFIDLCSKQEPISVAVSHPCSKGSLLGTIEAAQKDLIDPILVGPQSKIEAVAQEIGEDISSYRIIDTVHSHESASQAVALCRSGEAEALMKGSLHTDELMRAVAKRDTGLRTERRISHIFVLDVPTYPRALFITDAAINIYPTLEDKVDILQNAIDLAHAIGLAEPKVAILSAVETVSPKIPSTLEAAALCKMADRGQITGAIIDGPLALDNAINKEAAQIKNISSPVAGEANILLTPDLEAGNMLAKQLQYLAKAEAAGIVLGARVPIILTSRADTARARLASCAVAVAVAHKVRTGVAIR